MISSATIYLSQSVNPHENLAMEEAMLRGLPSGQAILFLWQNAHTVVIGAGQNAWRECDVRLLREEGGTLARRSSGGGAVYHDLGNLNFSFIVPRADYDVDRQLRVVMNAVRSLGLNAKKTGRNDLTVDGRKFSGNAFRLLSESALHHGTLLIASDSAKVARYLTPDQDKLKAKGVKSVSSRIVNLGTLSDVTVEAMRDAMISAFRLEYGHAEIAQPTGLDFPEYPVLLPRYRSWDWNYGSSPEGFIELSRRFAWGGVQLAAKVVGGTAQEVCAYTDSMDETLSARLSESLTGCPWRAEALAERAGQIGEDEIAAWLRQSV